MVSLHGIVQKLGDFFNEGSDELLLPILFFFMLFPETQETSIGYRKETDKSFILFFVVLFFILLTGSYANS
ncbi:MAG TPA: hypothetical protein GX527_02595 [Clostridiaceae bacterium]|jgi:hypothetical protein|nr:hypothetical protein [Clostridiaceae bacterium]